MALGKWVLGDAAVLGMLSEVIGLNIVFDVNLRALGRTPLWDMDILSLWEDRQ